MQIGQALAEAAGVRLAGSYVVFVTDAPPEVRPAELEARNERLRCEAETFFRSAKSGVGFEELPSRKPHVFEAAVDARPLRASTALHAMAVFPPRWRTAAV